MNSNLDEAPFETHLLLYCADGTIHSGKKRRGSIVSFQGTSKELWENYDYFFPIGVCSITDDEDAAYFVSDIIGWEVKVGMVEKKEK